MSRAILSGTVVKGYGLAKKIGFPTMNCGRRHLPKSLAYGVYAVRVRIAGTPFHGVAYYGPRLFHKRSVVFEVHCFGLKKHVKAKQRIFIEIKKRLRGVKHFSSLEALKAQIQKDVEAAEML